MQSLRGMYDILPADMKYWQYIYSTALETLEVASYYEIKTPIVEHAQLFLRSIGEGTDIVNKEMYQFKDGSGRELALRPEGTASIARAIIEHKLSHQNEIQRLWYMGPMFRYERPQYGRQRQFHQLGVECIGSMDPIADTEIIYLSQRLLTKFHCTDFKLEINSIGTVKDRSNYQEALEKYLMKYTEDLDQESQKRLVANSIKILDSKNKRTQEILENAPKLTEYISIDARIHFIAVQEYLQALGIKFHINDRIVRGLDYYNHTAFEIKTKSLGSQETICGGGRYDNLTKQLGGPLIPSVGCAIGIERLILISKHHIELEAKPIYFYIAIQGHEARLYALSILPPIQDQKIKYELNLSNDSLHKQLKRAVKKKALVCIIIGIDEVTSDIVKVKWLKEHREENYSRKEFINQLQNIKNICTKIREVT